MKTNKMSDKKLRSHGQGWLLVFGALLFLLFAGRPAQAQDLYKVTMTRPNITGVEGLTTDCNRDPVDDTPIPYILARGDSTGLTANGSDLDPETGEPSDLTSNLASPVAWTRKYDAGDGLSGVFNGCFGGPSGPTGYSGALFITFGGGKGAKSGSTVSFIWHFEYYIAPGVREHFSLLSDKIPFPAWTGSNVSGTVIGNFDFLHYLNDGSRRVKDYYQPVPGGQDRQFEFVLSIEKVQ